MFLACILVPHAKQSAAVPLGMRDPTSGCHAIEPPMGPFAGHVLHVATCYTWRPGVPNKTKSVHSCRARGHPGNHGRHEAAEHGGGGRQRGDSRGAAHGPGECCRACGRPAGPAGASRGSCRGARLAPRTERRQRRGHSADGERQRRGGTQHRCAGSAICSCTSAKYKQVACLRSQLRCQDGTTCSVATPACKGPVACRMHAPPHAGLMGSVCA